MNKEQANLIEIFSEERDRRDGEEETLRNKLEVPHSLNTFFSICSFDYHLYDHLNKTKTYHCRKHQTRSMIC